MFASILEDLVVKRCYYHIYDKLPEEITPNLYSGSHRKYKFQLQLVFHLKKDGRLRLSDAYR